MRILVILISACLLVSCYKRGPESKGVRLWSYDLVGDGNNNDSTYFHISIKNENAVPLTDPNLKFVVKDTSSKILFSTLFRDDQNIQSIPAYSTYDHYIFTNGFQINDEVGKVKIRFEWTNSEGSNSIRRYVESN